MIKELEKTFKSIVRHAIVEMNVSDRVDMGGELLTDIDIERAAICDIKNAIAKDILGDDFMTTYGMDLFIKNKFDFEGAWEKNLDIVPLNKSNKIIDVVDLYISEFGEEYKINIDIKK